MLGPDDRCSWITDYMLVGAQPDHADLELLRQAGVGAILNVRHHDSIGAARDVFNMSYAHVPMRDFSTPSARQLAECRAFIDEQRQTRVPVLIHCALGIGRSATVALAYLMVEGASLDDALDLLKRRRTLIQPSAAQIAAAVHYATKARTNAGESI
jgi:protein-tyrosine phosphatase